MMYGALPPSSIPMRFTCADALDLVRRYGLPQAATRVRETLKPGEPADFVEHEALCDLRSPSTEAALWCGLCCTA